MTDDNPAEKSIGTQRTAVLLMAHGSRRAEANDDLVELAKRITECGEYDFVQVSYLELAPPTILEGGRACVQRNATRVLMLPFFLSAGVHVEHDLAEARQTLSREFPKAQFILCPPLGLHPLITDIVLDRLRQGQ